VRTAVGRTRRGHLGSGAPQRRRRHNSVQGPVGWQPLRPIPPAWGWWAWPPGSVLRACFHQVTPPIFAVQGPCSGDHRPPQSPCPPRPPRPGSSCWPPPRMPRALAGAPARSCTRAWACLPFDGLPAIYAASTPPPAPLTACFASFPPPSLFAEKPSLLGPNPGGTPKSLLQ
jgi:hypothetical protein